MSPRRSAIWFFIKVIVLYAAFAWPFPAVEAAYSRGFAAATEWVLGVDRNGPPGGVLGTEGIVLVYSKYETDPEHDINIVVGNTSNLQGSDKPKTSSRNLGYMPTAVLAALVLATPIAWKRRWISLVMGLLAVHLFIAMRVALVLVKLFHGDAGYCLFRWSAPWDRALEEAFRIISEVPATTYVVPLILWLAVTFRRDDWDSLVAGLQRNADAMPQPTPRRRG